MWSSKFTSQPRIREHERVSKLRDENRLSTVVKDVLSGSRVKKRRKEGMSDRVPRDCAACAGNSEMWRHGGQRAIRTVSRASVGDERDVGWWWRRSRGGGHGRERARCAAVDCIEHGRRERDAVEGARKMTGFPRSWRRDRTCARENSVRASVSAASRGRDGATVVPHHHGVGHSAAFPERVQFPAEFGEFSRVASSWSFARLAYRALRGRRRAMPSIIELWPPNTPLVISPLRSRATRHAPRLGSPELDRLPLPYLAAHWQPRVKRDFGGNSPPRAASTFAGRDPRPWVAVAETKGLDRVNKRR